MDHAWIMVQFTSAACVSFGYESMSDVSFLIINFNVPFGKEIPAQCLQVKVPIH
jgi:hypothetical protein